MTNVTVPTAIPAMAPGLMLEFRSFTFVGGGMDVGVLVFDEIVAVSPKGTLIANARDDA
jgi:hypothetical protein